MLLLGLGSVEAFLHLALQPPNAQGVRVLFAVLLFSAIVSDGAPDAESNGRHHASVWSARSSFVLIDRDLAEEYPDQAAESSAEQLTVLVARSH